MTGSVLRARLSEDDVAARLAVDPKTVRRWMEGRLPYLRHRWELAGLLSVDEADLWPEVSAARSRPEEIRAIYPHRDSVPRDVWLVLFGSARREIAILSNSSLFLAEDPAVLAALSDRIRVGVRVRICLYDPESHDIAAGAVDPGSGDALAARIAGALPSFIRLRESGEVEIRVHGAVLNNSIYRADDELLVSQYVYGVVAGQTPVLHLRRADSGDMVATYVESFEDVWADARPLA